LGSNFFSLLAFRPGPLKRINFIQEVSDLDQKFTIEFDEGNAARFFTGHPDALIITQPEIWESLEDVRSGFTGEVYFLETLEEDILNALAEKEKGRQVVAGFGGGRAADIAKFLNWKNKTSLVQIPTIISVDAFFTREIAVRKQNVVSYIGNAIPEMVLVDYSVIRRAPVLLNRSGLGDILSCRTGLYDWHLASQAGHSPAWNDKLSGETEELLTRVEEKLEAICAVTPKGISILAEALNWIGHRCWLHGHPRFEEGSEHHFVYNLEYITGKNFVHGQAVCLGCCILSLLQNNNPQGIREAVARAGISIRPEDMGITRKEIEATLLTLNDFVIREKLPYTILHERKIDQPFVKMVFDRLGFS
jgi:glycerol-1-phosphate dehydrogenase [NAD(P)+]